MFAQALSSARPPIPWLLKSMADTFQLYSTAETDLLNASYEYSAAKLWGHDFANNDFDDVAIKR